MVRPFDVSKFRTSLTKNIQGISVGFESDPNTWVDTGNYTLNYLISGDFDKGIPLGRVTMLAGESGSGKSLIASGNIIRNAQKQGIFCVALDSENALHEDWLQALGVDTSPDKMLRIQVAMVDDVAKIISDFITNYKKDYDTIILSGNTQIDLLRKLYEAAMLCGDWVTCITSSEQLLQKHSNNENPIKLAKIFALMQGCRISLAWKELQIDNVSVPIDNLGGIECQILWYLYKADVSILLKRVVQLNDNDDNVDGNKDSTEMKQEIEKIHSLTTFSWSLCEKLMKKRKSDDSIKSQIHQELMIAVWNNFGLTWFLKGNMFKAMSSFRKAIQYVQEQQDTSMQKSNSLHVFFNMSLLLWKHGHKQEATKIWLTARGFITTIEAEKPLSDTESKRATIERLKRDLQKAVKKNELINEEIKIGKYELSLEPITRWHPSVQRDENSNHQNADCIGGIQPDQCTAVDIMLLRHMVWYLAREDGSQFLQNSRY